MKHRLYTGGPFVTCLKRDPTGQLMRGQQARPVN
jgi:hypothetical protein